MWLGIRTVLWKSILLFIEKDAASRGAAIAFYVVTSLAPVLVIVIAIAGLVFGEEAARGAIYVQLRGLLGENGAGLLQSTILSASTVSASVVAMIISAVTLFLVSSGVFVELEAALNSLWGVQPRGKTLSQIVRPRIASIGLVLAIGFLLIVALIIDAAMNGVGSLISDAFPFGAAVLYVVSFLFSFALTAVLFGAIYRIMPGVSLRWRDVAFGALLTTLLFQIGKLAIGYYLGTRGLASSLGAGGALIGLLFWVYYSSMIFLFGAAVMRVLLESRWEKYS